MLLIFKFIKNLKILLKSWVIKIILKFIGLKIGKSFICYSMPDLKINGKSRNIQIGDGVTFKGKVDLRNREDGIIIINNKVTIEENVRIVSARNGKVEIGNNTIIATGTIMNGGGNIYIGEDSIIGPYNVINANDHKIDLNLKIIDREFIYGNIVVDKGCWTGAFVSIKKNVHINENSVIGAHSLVTKDTEKNSINFGVPSKKVRERS